MANVMEGLTQAPPEENVNSEAGFEAALARKAGTTDALEGRETTNVGTTIADGLTVGTDDDPLAALRARYEEQAGDTPNADEEETPDEEDTEEAQTSDVDPNITALLAKHGGDPVAALAELNDRFTNAQSVIGRQGNELGQVRQEIAELRGELRGVTSSISSPATQVTTDDISEMISSRGGANVAMWAIQNGDDALVEATIREWAKQNELEGESTFEPLAFRQDWLAFKASQNAPKPTEDAPTRDPYAARLEQQEQMSGALGVLQAQSPDWETFAPHLMTALENSPKAVLEMVTSQDPQVQLDGMSLVADRARVIAASKAVATTTATEEASRAAAERKRAATVASGSLRPVEERQTEEQSSEQRVAAFKAALLATETTSVRDGLTFGK